MSTSMVNLSTDEYVKINSGFNPILMQANRDSVHIVFSKLKPARSNKAFFILDGSDEPLNIPSIDTNIWALGKTDKSSLIISEFTKSVETGFGRTAFGEMKVESMKPITQITSQYGILRNTLSLTDSSGFGSNYIQDDKIVCDSSANAGGLATVITLRHLKYRPGQGIVARLTAIFDQGVVGNVQSAGLITAQNTLAFGYVNDVFGIRYSHGGVDEVQELTLSTPAAGPENASITIDDTVYVVALTGGTTVQNDAYEIAKSLSTQVSNYNFTSNNNQVVAQSVLPGPQGVFAYSSATSTGTFTEIVIGVDAIEEFIPQTQWNRDTKSDLIPQNGNVYQIQFKYLGFGNISFYVQDSSTGLFTHVHEIEYANTRTIPNVTNPIFRIGWLSFNTTNDTSVKIQGSSAAGFVEGDIFRDNPQLSVSNDQLNIGPIFTNILAIRNRITLGNKINRNEILPLIITASSQTNKAAFFKLIINPTFSAPVVFNYVDKDKSIAEISKDKVQVSGGEEIATFTVVNGSPTIVSFNERPDVTSAILPGDIGVIVAQTPIASPADCQASITWQEDS